MSGPINERPELPNLSHLYVAMSGAGKTQALKQNPAIPRRGARVVLWDPNNDHQCTRLRTRHEFAKQVAKGIQSGKGFRIGYTPHNADPDEFEWFALVVWNMLRGDKITYVICEELADVSRHAGTAPAVIRKLMNQGRKYGMRFHGVSQRPEEIYKTFYSQVGITYYGRQKTMAQCKKFGKEIDKEAIELKTLPDLCFFIDDSKTVIKKQLKYKG